MLHDEQKYTCELAMELRQVVLRYARSPNVAASLRRNGHSEEDLVQETLLKLLRYSRRDCVSAGKLRRIVRKATRNCFLDLMKGSRLRSRRTSPLDGDFPAKDAQYESLPTLIAGLSDDDKSLILAKFAEGLSNACIADDLGVSKATVFRRLQSVITSLRTAFC